MQKIWRTKRVLHLPRVSQSPQSLNCLEITRRETQDPIPMIERLKGNPAHNQVLSSLQRRRNQGHGHIQGAEHPKRDQDQGHTQNGIAAEELNPSQVHVPIHTTVGQDLGPQDEEKDHSLGHQDVKDHFPGHAINLLYLKALEGFLHLPGKKM